MSTSERQEAVWASIPEGTPPADAELRLRLLLAALQRVRRDGSLRVLDVGCGEGWFAQRLIEEGMRVTAADIAEEPLRRAHAACPQLEALLLDPEAPLPLEDASFDAVWAGETIEHLIDTQTWLSELRRVLRSGGVLALSTPNHSPLTLASLALSPARFAEHFGVCGEHLRFYNRRSLALLLEGFGLESVRVHAAGGPPGLRRVLFASAVRARF